MAFRPTLRALAKERSDIKPALKKWWKYHVPTEGMVTRHLSPFEQDIIMPMFKKMPDNGKRFVRDTWTFWATAVGFFVGVRTWANNEEHKEAMSLRD